MKNKYFIIGLLIYSLNSLAQNWSLQHTDQNNSYYGINFINSTVGWVCGQNGAILATSDGGTNWTSQTSGTIQLLNSIHFLNGQIGKVVGNSGAIRITNDGGATWLTPASTGTTQTILCVQTTSADTAYYVDVAGRIGQTINGGQNWTIQTVSTSQLSGISFINNNTGWACGGNGEIYHTTNGGITWNAQNTGITDYLKNINFINSLQGWAVGDNGRIISTIDGGNNWTTQTMPNNQGYTLRDVKFISGTEGFIVGDMGIVLKTADSGTNWTIESGINNSNHFNSLTILANGDAWTAGTNNSNQGIVFEFQNNLTSLPENKFQSEFNIYPNPVQKELMIEVDSPTTLSIINVLGQELLNIKVDKKEVLYLEKLKSGTYFIKNTNNGISRIIVKE